MTEQPAAQEDAAAQRATEQARLRKERREARIRAGGASRLNKITGVAGNVPGGESYLSTYFPRQQYQLCPLPFASHLSTIMSHITLCCPYRLGLFQASTAAIIIPCHAYHNCKLTTPLLSSTETASPQATFPAPTPNPAAAASAASGTETPDPPEGDIAEHFPASSPGSGFSTAHPTDAQLRHMMLNFDTPPSSNTPPPPVDGAGGAGAGGGMPQMPPGMENDPFAQMLRQMMTAGPPPGSSPGGTPGVGSGAGGFPAMPGMGGPGGPGGPGADPFAAFSSLLNPAAGAQPGGQSPFGTPGQPTQIQAAKAKPLHIWRILHTLFTLGLIIYFAVGTIHYSGTLSQRSLTFHAQHLEEDSKDGADPDFDSSDSPTLNPYYDPHFAHGQKVFFISFATLESLLLTSRYLIERFSPGSRMDTRSGMLWSIAGFLPAPLGNWLETGLRYKSILDTLLQDLLLVVFVLGTVAWARS
ncbi:hypothetical protein MKZ38_009766 [Zalerion maritima]|uniref:Uncharacterized protein n=1 Tax=Zalerion maritima TaxID=339359 RepID=A0AAD5RZD8_9PEZI|nr:hypothetical protein MKZ38_009766 [Zalerion maritima]